VGSGGEPQAKAMLARFTSMVDVDMGRASTYDEIAVSGCSLTILGMHIVHHSEHKRHNIFVRNTGDVICKQDMR
jgi:hypothetical protein